MALAPNPATPDATPAQTDEAFYRDALHGLIAIGTSLARNLHDRATAQPASQPAPPQPEPAPTPEAAIAAFDRLARAVRRCIALARTLNQPAPDPARQRTTARKRILREVEDIIGREAREGDRAETLHAELRERLDDPDLDDDLDARPVPEIIAEICRDLGLTALPGTQPWKRRTPADLADLHARAAAPSRSPAPGHAPRQPASPVPPSPATPFARPAPAQDGGTSPEDPASLIAAILRHPAHARDRWRPPPAG